MSPILAVDLFPRTRQKSDINLGLSNHVEAAVLLTRTPQNHEMQLDPAPFAMIREGRKTIEMRLRDEKRQKIRVGDTITFTEAQTGETLRVAVVGLHPFENFEALYRALPLLRCGYTEATLAGASPRDMERYYSREKQKKYGVLGIEVSRLSGDTGPGETRCPQGPAGEER